MHWMHTLLVCFIFVSAVSSCENSQPLSLAVTSNDPHYNVRFSGRSLTAVDPNDGSQGHPLYNTYSKWIHERSHGAYGFSLDDDEGLKSCQSPTLNSVACPVCIPDETGANCKLPTKSLPDRVTKVAVMDANRAIVDPTMATATYKPSKSYLKPTWLTLYKFDARQGSIDTDFSVFPDNYYYAQHPTLTREHPFHVAFNVANQAGLQNSTCRMNIPIWVTIDAGSPNIILAYQKINPGEGYQFLINMYDDNLRKLLANKPTKLPNPFISGPLVANNGTERCAPECNAKDPRQVIVADCSDLIGRNPDVCNKTTETTKFPLGLDYCVCPNSTIRCDPNFKTKEVTRYEYVGGRLRPIVEKQCYDLRFPDDKQPTGFPHPAPCSPCFAKQPPLCSNLNSQNTPACCFNQKDQPGKDYSTAYFAGSQACAKGNYFDWQLGGGRIIISYVDPQKQDGIPPEEFRNQPKNCKTFSPPCNNAITEDWNAQLPQTGAKMAAAEQDNYAALLEFTVDYFMNLSGPSGFNGAAIFYDVSSVDSLNFPVYMKAVGENQNPQEKCVTNGGQCCFTFIGSPKHYLDDRGGTLKQNCPTDLFANKKNDAVVPWWGNCISAYGYCANRLVGASGVKAVDNPICTVWNNFENESPGFAKYKTVLTKNETDQPTIQKLANACRSIWRTQRLIATDAEATSFATTRVLWPDEKSCKAEFVTTDAANPSAKICCEPRMKDYVNRVIWGCENASAQPKENVKINNEKCRAMNWGVWPNFSQRGGKIIGKTMYEQPKELESPEAFKCNQESCDVAFADKPYDGSPQSMNCTGPTDPANCCGETSSALCWGITKP